MKRIQPTTALLLALLFVFFFVFFSQVHPLFPYDSDDWYHMSIQRWGLPIIHAWNPAKVFPELFFPTVSAIAAYTIYPITGDYFQAQTLVHAAVVSLFLTLYFAAFHRLFTKRFATGRGVGAMLTLLFLMLHFMVFPSRNEDAGHLFYSHDLNCYYNYIIPNVLNATLVMWLLATDWMRSNDFSLVKKGLLALAVYLALFSNLYSSEILTIFLGCQILVEMPCKGRGEMLQHLRKNRVKLVVIGLFLVSLVLEYNGGRASWQSRELLEEGDTLLARMATTADILTHTLFSRLFFALVMAMGLYGLWRTVRSRHLSAMAATLMATTAVTFIYVFLLCAKVMPHYIQRPDCLFAVFFPLLLLVCMACAELLRRHRKCTVALPFCLFVVFSRLLNTTYWLDIGQEHGRIDNLQRINAYILRQFTDADQSYRGDSVTIIVPKSDGPLNWPYLTAILNFDSMANTLYRHNVIHRKMVGKVVAGKPIDQY